VNSKGDGYDNTMTEAFNSLFNADHVRSRGPRKSIDDLKIAVAEHIDWFNFRCLTARSASSRRVELEDLHRSTTLPEQPAQRQLPVSIELALLT
jgi:putative transposase